VRVDVRVLAATHVDLAARVADGRFRRDLLARLNGLVLELPSLDERREDLGLLIAALLTAGGARGAAGLGREREACAAFAHAVTVLEHANGPDHPDLASFLGDHADCLMEAGRAKEALAAAERAVKIGEQAGRDPILVAVARYSLGRALWDTGGDRHRAVELVAAAHTIYAAGPPAGRSATARMAAWLSTHHAP